MVERVLSIAVAEITAVADIDAVRMVDKVLKFGIDTELLLETTVGVPDRATLDSSAPEAKVTWHPLLPLSQMHMVPGAIGCHITLPKLQRP